MDGRRRPLVAGNWKMNGSKASSGEVRALLAAIGRLSENIELLICPPATLIASFADLAAGTPLRIGAQDCHAQPAGAFTGDLSAEMLADAGAMAVIVGHSERRTLHGESDREVQAKATAAHRAGIDAIVCVGETETQRAGGKALDTVGRQLAGSLPERSGALVVAYEPVWAIGTGLTPTTYDVAEMHGFIRARLVERYGDPGRAIRILYGGSVKPSNARELLATPEVDGALVGGASLKAADFLAIAAAYS
jgi:triosephosphate isomerase